MTQSSMIISLLLTIMTTTALLNPITQTNHIVHQYRSLSLFELHMARSFKPTDPYAPVKNKSKKSSKYGMPGYMSKDLDVLKVVFQLYSNGNEHNVPCLSLESLFNSKYLRYWPGTDEDAENIWRVVVGSGLNKELGSNTGPDSGFESEPITFKQLPYLLSQLDKFSDVSEKEMEMERKKWELDDLNHNRIEDFFDRTSRFNLLSFNDFIVWEGVKEELWYNEKGLKESDIADIWVRLVGCTSKECNRQVFTKIFNIVCGAAYEV
jgi:hypothetical protein